jgi:hypothetical protein
MEEEEVWMMYLQSVIDNGQLMNVVFVARSSNKDKRMNMQIRM